MLTVTDDAATCPGDPMDEPGCGRQALWVVLSREPVELWADRPPGTMAVLTCLVHRVRAHRWLRGYLDAHGAASVGVAEWRVAERGQHLPQDTWLLEGA